MTPTQQSTADKKLRKGSGAACPIAEAHKTEARETVQALARNEGDTRELVLLLHEKQMYKALSYRSFDACVKSEIGWSRRTAYRRLDSARVARALGHFRMNLCQDLCQKWHRFWREEWYLQIAKLPESEWKETSDEITNAGLAVTYTGKAAQFHEKGQITTEIVRTIVQRRLSEQEPDAVNINAMGVAGHVPASSRSARNCLHSVTLDPDTNALHCVAGNGQTAITFRIEEKEMQRLGWHREEEK